MSFLHPVRTCIFVICTLLATIDGTLMTDSSSILAFYIECLVLLKSESYKIVCVYIFINMCSNYFYQETQYRVIGGEVDSLFSVHSETIAEN